MSNAVRDVSNIIHIYDTISQAYSTCCSFIFVDSGCVFLDFTTKGLTVVPVNFLPKYLVPISFELVYIMQESQVNQFQL